jgi:3-oxoacyl-[acyl-carrier-protein] synthase II
MATRIAAEVKDSEFDSCSYVEPPKLVKTMSRAVRFAVGAAAMARQSAALGTNEVDPTRAGVCLGVGGMGVVDVEMLFEQAGVVLASADGSGHLDIPSFARLFRERVNPLTALRGLPNLAAAHVAIQQRAQGPNSSIATACTAGTQAIGEGMRLIQRGEADVIFAGGTDAMVNPVGLLGFGMLGTLSRRNDDPERASRPFDRNRDGFVLGEGAAVVVLERLGFARARGARIASELIGYAATCDAFRITDERPDASLASRAIGSCLRDAGIAPEDVGYINAHGTSTPMNDRTETRAIKEAFGKQAYRTPVSSTKSMTGHLLAAAGAVELVASVISIDRGFLPPTINYEEFDPECDLDYVPNVARPARVETALSTSFGFGGQNACLLVRRL